MLIVNGPRLLFITSRLLFCIRALPLLSPRDALARAVGRLLFFIRALPLISKLNSLACAMGRARPHPVHPPQHPRERAPLQERPGRLVWSQGFGVEGSGVRV